jgi:hypothetical protein
MSRDKQTDRLPKATGKQVESVKPGHVDEDENDKVPDSDIQGDKAGQRMRELQAENPDAKIGGQSKKKLN